MGGTIDNSARPSMNLRRHAAAVVLAIAALAPGVWGGDHLRMVVSDTGARLEYECAESTIDRPIAPDSRGNFTARGRYFARRGGPRRADQAGGVRVRYTGHVSADTMTLTVRLERERQPVGVYSLRRGVDALLATCR